MRNWFTFLGSPLALAGHPDKHVDCTAIMLSGHRDAANVYASGLRYQALASIRGRGINNGRVSI